MPRNEDINAITAKQAVTFIIATQIGVGILRLPSTLAKYTNHDGWISTIFGGILVTTLLFIIVLILAKHQDKSILDINVELLGHKLGQILNLIFIFYMYLMSIFILRILCEIIQISLLRLTPPLIIALFIMIPVAYSTWYGLKIICRYDSLTYFIIFMSFIYFYLIHQYIQISFIKPIGEAGIQKIFSEIPQTTFTFIGFELIAIIYPFIVNKEKIVKLTFFSSLFVTFIFTIFVFIPTAIYGENLVKLLYFPLFSLSDLYKSTLFERVDILFISIWCPIIFMDMLGYFFCTFNSLQKVINMKKNLPLLLFLSISIMILSRVPENLEQTYKYSNLLSVIGVLIMCYFVVFNLIAFAAKKVMYK